MNIHSLQRGLSLVFAVTLPIQFGFFLFAPQSLIGNLRTDLLIMAPNCLPAVIIDPTPHILIGREPGARRPEPAEARAKAAQAGQYLDGYEDLQRKYDSLRKLGFVSPAEMNRLFESGTLERKLDLTYVTFALTFLALVTSAIGTASAVLLDWFANRHRVTQFQTPPEKVGV